MVIFLPTVSHLTFDNISVDVFLKLFSVFLFPFFINFLVYALL